MLSKIIIFKQKKGRLNSRPFFIAQIKPYLTQVAAGAVLTVRAAFKPS
jgi:hypothetical protein